MNADGSDPSKLPWGNVTKDTPRGATVLVQIADEGVVRVVAGTYIGRAHPYGLYYVCVDGLKTSTTQQLVAVVGPIVALGFVDWTPDGGRTHFGRTP